MQAERPASKSCGYYPGECCCAIPTNTPRIRSARMESVSAADSRPTFEEVETCSRTGRIQLNHWRGFSRSCRPAANQRVCVIGRHKHVLDGAGLVDSRAGYG